MSGHGGKRGKKHEEHEEHENHERWAVSYADMMTVLMALFLVLFAMSNVDTKKYLELKTSLAEGFGKEVMPTDGGDGIVDGSTKSIVDVGNGPDSGTGSNPSTSPAKTTGAQAAADAAAQAAAQEVKSLEELQEQVEAKIAAQGLQQQVTTTITERGLVISVAANNIFFASGSAAVEPTGLSVLDLVAPLLNSTTNQVSVEGHANNLAISGGQYANNWDLSSARATAVLLRLQSDGVASERLRATGFGDAHPLFPASDPRALEGNRRVDIVLLADGGAPDDGAAKASGADASPAKVPAIEAGAAPDISPDAAPASP